MIGLRPTSTKGRTNLHITTDTARVTIWLSDRDLAYLGSHAVQAAVGGQPVTQLKHWRIATIAATGHYRAFTTFQSPTATVNIPVTPDEWAVITALAAQILENRNTAA